MRRHVVGTIGNTIGTGGCDAREIGVGVGVEVGGDYKPATLSMSRGHAIELNSEQPRTPCTGAGAVHACGSLTILWYDPNQDSDDNQLRRGGVCSTAVDERRPLVWLLRVELRL